MSELVTKEALAVRARDTIADTGCNWRDAALKVLEGVRLSTEDRDYLLSGGLAAYARVSLNRPSSRRGSEISVPSAEELLEPIAGFIALGRVFQVGDTNKPFLECNATDVGLIIEHLKVQRAGFTRSIEFMADVKIECERFKCKVKELPTIRQLEEKAPW